MFEGQTVRRQQTRKDRYWRGTTRAANSSTSSNTSPHILLHTFSTIVTQPLKRPNKQYTTVHVADLSRNATRGERGGGSVTFEAVTTHQQLCNDITDIEVCICPFVWWYMEPLNKAPLNIGHFGPALYKYIHLVLPNALITSDKFWRCPLLRGSLYPYFNSHISVPSPGCESSKLALSPAHVRCLCWAVSCPTFHLLAGAQPRLRY